jgi:CRP-like cAMP-binding protein
MQQPTFMNLLSEATRDSVMKTATLMHYQNNQLIHTRGQTKPGLSIVSTGSVHVGVSDTEGVFVMAGILGPGESFGEFTLFADLPRTHDAIAFGPTTVFQIPQSRFIPLYQKEPEIASALLKSSLLRTHQLLEQLDAIRRLPLLERTAKALLSMSDSSGNKSGVACLQSDLAFALGVTRVSAGKVLKQLAGYGLIELGYRQIHFPDKSKLESWVEEHCNTTPLRW